MENEAMREKVRLGRRGKRKYSRDNENHLRRSSYATKYPVP
jgi:hypothetical protein